MRTDPARVFYPQKIIQAVSVTFVDVCGKTAYEPPIAMSRN